MDGKLRSKPSRVIRHIMDETFGHSSEASFDQAYHAMNAMGERLADRAGGVPRVKKHGPASERALTSYTPPPSARRTGTGPGNWACVSPMF